MTKTISIITPVGGSAAGFLGDAYRSIRSQELPSGWEFEWLVQQDGAEVDVVSPALPVNDARVSVGDNRRGGPAVARNMALARATGSLVKVLDADDQLAPGALFRDITVMSAGREVEWTTSRVLDLMVDGTTRGFEGDPSPGYQPVGSVLSSWETNDFRAPVHPATLCARTAVVEMLGGWMALPASEDTGLLLALSAIAGGNFTPEVGLYYRKWTGQMTAPSAHVDPRERAARMALIGRRAHRLRAAPNPLRTALPDAGDAR